MTIREASEVTGVPTSTIRKWARSQHIPSFMEQTENGQIRIVSMNGIRRRAEALGRSIGGEAPSIQDEGQARSGSAKTHTSGTAALVHDETGAPEGTMLVPLDAWNRMLNQLGNLHDAGQQLAEARERAAKAETEARFLKERLAEVRQQLESEKRAASGFQSDASSTGDHPSPTSLVRSIYRSWRAGRR